MVKHAHAQEDKDARRNAILGAALSLFLEETRRLPAVAAIAARAGLAKGTVYLYFATKEQIFAALFSREWQALLAEVESLFAGAPAGDRNRAAARFTDGFVTFLAAHPYFLRLDALGYGQLEANLPVQEFRPFKRSFAATLQQAGRSVEEALHVPAGAGFALLLHSYALARGLYQTLDRPEGSTDDDRPGDDPLTGIDFAHQLRAALGAYWRGALDGVSSLRSGNPAASSRLAPNDPRR